MTPSSIVYFSRFLLLASTATALIGFSSQTQAQVPDLLADARELVAEEQYADAYRALTQLAVDGDADAGLLREWIGERQNQKPPRVIKRTEWIEYPDTQLLTIIKTKGVSALAGVYHDGNHFRTAGLSSFFTRSQNPKSAIPARLAMSQAIVDFLHTHPWVWFTERGSLLAEHHDLLVKSDRADDAIDFLANYCLPREARLCLHNKKDTAPDQPETWPFLGAARVSPIDMLLKSLAANQQCVSFAERLKNCRQPEAQFLRQLALLCEGDTSEIDDFLAALIKEDYVLYREAGGEAMQDRYLVLLGRFADKNESYAAAAVAYERAFTMINPERAEQAKLILGSLVLALNQAKRSEDVGPRLIDLVFQPNVNPEARRPMPGELQRHALRLGRSSIGEDAFDTLLSTAMPEHPLVRIPALKALILNGSREDARNRFDELWRDNPVALLAESNELPQLFETPREFVDALQRDEGFGNALRAASPAEAKTIADRLAVWSQQPEDTNIVQDVRPWLELSRSALLAHNEARRLRYPAFQKRVIAVAKSLVPRLDQAADRKAWYPLFILPADTLTELGLEPLPGSESRPDQFLQLANIAAELPVEQYIALLDSNELSRIESALPAGSGLRWLTAAQRGAPMPEGDPGLTFSWLAAKTLLKNERIHDVLVLLRNLPDRREMPGLLYVADQLIEANQTTAARYILSLGSADVGDPAERLHRIRLTSRKLADLGLYPDAIDQAKQLITSPLPRLQKEGLDLVLSYEREWLAALPREEIKAILDEKMVRLKNNPTDVELLEQCYRLYVHQKQYNAALKLLVQRAEMQPTNPLPRVRMAIFHARYLNQPTEAWFEFLRAHELSPRSWIDAGQIGLIREVAVNQSVFLDRLTRIELRPTDEVPRTAAQYYNVLDRSMRVRKVDHPESLLALTNTLLAFPKTTVAQVRPRLSEFRVRLLLQLGQEADGRHELRGLYTDGDGPTWDMRLTEAGPEGLAVTYRDMFGTMPKVKTKVWAALLAGWEAELGGQAIEAAAHYKQALPLWPNAIADQVPHLIARLRIVDPSPATDGYLLNYIRSKNVGRPDVLHHVIRNLVSAGQGEDALGVLNRLSSAGGLTEAGRQRVVVMAREVEFVLKGK